MVKQEAFDLRARFSDINLSFFSSSYFLYSRRIYSEAVSTEERRVFFVLKFMMNLVWH